MIILINSLFSLADLDDICPHISPINEKVLQLKLVIHIWIFQWYFDQ